MVGYGIDNIKEWFKNHNAELRILDSDTQVLIWKQPGTRMYEIDFVFYKNMVYITGDMRDAVFNTTWFTSWDCNGWRICLDYFAGKLSCIENGKYAWNRKVAVKYLKEEYREYFDGTDEAYEEAIEYIIKEQITDQYELEDSEIPYRDYFSNDEALLQMCLAISYASESESVTEFEYYINSCSDFYDFNDFWEWGYDCGKVLNPDIEVYLVALQMAYDQLSSKGVKNNEN